MIRAVAQKPDGRRAIIFGIEEENVKRLKDGKPMLISLDELGVSDTEVLILYGETTKELEEMLSPLMDKATEVIVRNKSEGGS